jgi:hypothetical protein
MTTSGLRVRQHERAEIDLDADLVIGEAHRAQLRFSSASGIQEAFVVPCRVDDLSTGGAGLLSSQFVPRQISGTLRIYGTDDLHKPSGMGHRRVILERAVRIRRVSMRDLEPTYALGVSFDDADAGLGQRVQQVLAQYASKGADGA